MDSLSKPLPADEHELRRLRDLAGTIKDELGNVWADLDNFARLILRQSTVNHPITELWRRDDAPIVDVGVLRRLSDVTDYLPASERQTVSREVENVVRLDDEMGCLADHMREAPFVAEAADAAGKTCNVDRSAAEDAVTRILTTIGNGPLYQRAAEAALRILNAVRSVEDSIVAELNRRSAKAPGESELEGAGAGSEGDRTPAPGDATPTGDETNRDKFDKLPKARRLAYFAFQYAAEKSGTHPTRFLDRDAWDWLNENGIDEPDEIAGELANYRPPESFSTWVKYLGDARTALGEQKHRRGTPAPTGHSVVRRDEL
jgi:hypothetical protein